MCRTSSAFSIWRYFEKRIEEVDYKQLRRQIGIDQSDLNLSLLQASGEADLIVDESRYLVIWLEREVEFRGDSKPWKYFWRLCCAACSGRWIGSEDFVGTMQPRNLADWKSRLGKVTGFPQELLERIDVFESRHRLNVDAKRIRVLPLQAAGAPVV